MVVLNNIAKVVADELCAGCGTCVAVCPFDAVSMGISGGLLLPVLDEGKCTGCGKCLECCPGRSVDMRRMNFEVFGKQPEDSVLGSFLKCYIGHSNDSEICGNSSSGGIATHLLVYALEKGLIDGAVVARMKRDDPLKSEAFVARTREEIVSASKSKYCPVATNTVLKAISTEDGRFAVVGLPCHMHGIRMAEALSDELKSRIVLHVGLFCGHTVSFEGTEVLLRKLRIDREQVEVIEYRGHGWPGSMSVKLKGGKERQFRFFKSWKAYWNLFSPFLFTPLRCLMCPDLFNEVSDVSVGDAWLPELAGGKIGQAVIISRTGVAEKMLRDMSKEKAVWLEAVPSSKVKESQAFSLNFKKESLSGRLSVFGMLGEKVPHIKPEPCRSRALASFGGILSYCSYRISSSKRLRSMLIYVPLPLFRLYFGVFKCLFQLSTNTRRLGRLGMRNLPREERVNVPSVKIHLIHVGNMANKGTQALVSTDVRVIKSIAGGSAVVSVSTADVEGMKRLGLPAGPVVDSTVDIPYERADAYAKRMGVKRSSLSYKMFAVASLLYMFVQMGLSAFSAVLAKAGLKPFYRSESLVCLRDCDLVVSCSDENFKESASMLPSNVFWIAAWWSMLVSRMWEVLVARFLGKSVVMFPNSVGPFRTVIGRVLSKMALSNFACILVREPISLGMVASLGVRTNKVLTSDTTLLFDPPEGRASKYRFDGAVGVCAGFYSHSLSERSISEYVSAHAEALDRAIEKFGFSVVFLPHYVSGFRYDDFEVSRLILGKMRNAYKARIVEAKTVEEFKQLIGQMEMIVSSKMHPGVLAATSYVPFVSVAYDHKQTGFCADLDMSNCVIPLGEISSEKLLAKIDYVWNRRSELGASLETRIPELQAHVRKSIELVLSPFVKKVGATKGDVVA